jgi:Rv2525c-like, glycoside hydrolase-like domain
MAAAPGAQGFDTDTALVAASAGQLFETGFRFAIRYLSRTVPQNRGDLGSAEAETVLGAGLALMAVQHCSRAGWAPTTVLGGSYGHAAVLNATAIGFPIGVSLWLDLEEVATYATAANTIGYVNAWAGEVSDAGFVPGLYVGANQPLTGDELYWRLKVSRYWRSASKVPDIAYRGYCMAQALMPSPVSDGADGTLSIDRDVIMADAFGGVPIWLAPIPVLPASWAPRGEAGNVS